MTTTEANKEPKKDRLLWIVGGCVALLAILSYIGGDTGTLLNDNDKLYGIELSTQDRRALIVRSAADWTEQDCSLTVNDRFERRHVDLPPGETRIPWSSLMTGNDMRYNPLVDALDTLSIYCGSSNQSLLLKRRH